MRSEWNAEPVIRIRLHRKVSLAVLVAVFRYLFLVILP